MDDEQIASSDELYETHTIVCAKGQEPLRIDKFLMNRIEGATRNKIQQAIEQERVLVNSRPVKSNYKIRPDDTIVVYQDYSPDLNEIVPENIPINIVFEDEDVLVIDKPAGMVVHPGSGNPSGTLVNAVAFHLLQQDPNLTEEDLNRFGLVHRIDKNTSGLLVLAKNQQALAFLARQFFEHTVHRRYMALVWGDLPDDSGTIVAHVGRNLRFRKLFDAFPEGDHGKDAITHYEVKERFNYTTLVECRLETGRTHQIRVHMKYIGHPLFNDELYGGDRIVKGTVFSKYKQFIDNCFAICPRHALHAYQLGFIHPVTKESLFFESKLPEDMEGLLQKWRAYTSGSKR
ncbi:MAG: RluA family pseudouridine synthase [Chitinophagaceae bacterium]|nr:RluA family pseudouridine synthase [Chitinophagaceae bacterium]MCZ2397279.1 RluA family pseudouridine synthase [Chitinophagales bacterium]